MFLILRKSSGFHDGDMSINSYHWTPERQKASDMNFHIPSSLYFFLWKLLYKTSSDDNFLYFLLSVSKGAKTIILEKRLVYEYQLILIIMKCQCSVRLCKPHIPVCNSPLQTEFPLPLLGSLFLMSPECQGNHFFNTVHTPSVMITSQLARLTPKLFHKKS